MSKGYNYNCKITSEIVNKLIRQRKCETIDKLSNAFIVCSEEGYTDVAILLLCHSTMTNKVLLESLNNSSINGHLDFVKMLTNNTHRLHIYMKKNSAGFSFLDLALFQSVNNGHREVVFYLIKKGSTKWRINPKITNWILQDILNARMIMNDKNIGGGFERILDDYFPRLI